MPLPAHSVVRIAAPLISGASAAIGLIMFARGNTKLAVGFSVFALVTQSILTAGQCYAAETRVLEAGGTGLAGMQGPRLMGASSGAHGVNGLAGVL